MRIGELARRVGVDPRTIRYYESIGVLPEPARAPSGYRDYDEEDVERLRFIRAAQGLGLRLNDIAEVMAFRERGERPCDFVLEVVRREIEQLNRRMREMRTLKRELEDLVARADQRRVVEGAKYCPLIAHRSGL